MEVFLINDKLQYLFLMYVLLPFLLLFVLFLINAERSKLLVFSLFNNRYFFEFTTENARNVTIYNIIVLLFIIVSQTILLDVMNLFYYARNGFFYSNFWLFGFYICVYNIVKVVLHQIVANFSRNVIEYKHLLRLETGYLVSTLVMILPVVLIMFSGFQFSLIKHYFIFFLLVVLFVYRGISLLFNNKMLVASNMLYIILYLCILEIIPFVYTYIIVF